MTERGFHPFAVLHFLRKTILLYLCRGSFHRKA